MKPLEMLGIGIVLLLVYYLYTGNLDPKTLLGQVIPGIIAATTVAFMLTVNL